MLPESKYYSKLEAQKHETLLSNLKQEIKNNPFMKHRIILRELKKAESTHLQKAIRKLFLSEF